MDGRRARGRRRTDDLTRAAGRATRGPNYAWYQFRLKLAARDLYRDAGEAAIPRLFETFRLDDASLADRLGRTVSPVLGELAIGF